MPYQIKESDGSVLAQYVSDGAGRARLVSYLEPEVQLNLYQDAYPSPTCKGIDRFGRVKNQLWTDYVPNPDIDLVDLNYGHDYASNRTWREDVVAATNSKDHDEFYDYDGLDRLKNATRGNLTGAPPTGVTAGSRNLEQDWTLDQLGNWSNFDEDADGDGTNNLDQVRYHNDANEIDGNSGNPITEGMGQTAWTSPVHDKAGNMTTMPQPKSLASSYTAIYDAWNRLVEIKDGTTVATYEYDGLNRRIVKVINSATRHFYYSGMQVLEEREGTETNADIQYVWGTRYIDDLILRDRDADDNGTSLEERLYALQDANWNIVALTDETGAVKQRFQYDPYGGVTKLNPNFTAYTGMTDYAWEYTYTSRRLDDETGLMYYRARYYHTALGRFIGRDPIEYVDGMNLLEYTRGAPVSGLDPSGELRIVIVSKHTPSFDGTALWWRLWGDTDQYSEIGPEIDSDDNITKEGSERIAEILEAYGRCTSVLWVSGHGLRSGVNFGRGQGFNYGMDPATAARIAKKLCKNAIVTLCSCGAGLRPDRLQVMANMLQAKVCGCAGDVTSPCKCKGDWVCLKPNNEDVKTLRDRLEALDAKKGKNKNKNKK